MGRYDEVMTKAHEMSCTHQHLRADECDICRKEYESIARELQRQSGEKHYHMADHDDPNFRRCKRCGGDLMDELHIREVKVKPNAPR